MDPLKVGARSIPRMIVVISIEVIIALMHVLRPGQIFRGAARALYYSYFSDFIVPFGMYFLLAANDAAVPVVRRWPVKAGLVFAAATCAEIGQLLGVEVLGVTFDPYDILLYGLGVLAAAFVDVKVFAKIFRFWANPAKGL